jgi:ribose transport system substrate-binding protein
VGAAEDILTANPDVAAFYGACQGPTEGAISALANANIDPSEVIVVGFDGADSELEAIAQGTEAATVMQFPDKIGELGVATLYKAINGEQVPAFVDTGTALITQDNLDQFRK